MNELTGQVQKLAESWAPVFETLKANPSLLTTHVPEARPEQVDELVRTVVKWTGFIRAPKGFNPAFHVAKALAVTALPAANTATTRLAAGDYTILPGFLASIGQIASAYHLMMVFAPKDAATEAVASLGAMLTENLALVGTAQAELEQKARALAAATQLLTESESASERAQEAADRASKALSSATAAAASAESARLQAEESVSSIEEIAELAEQTAKANAAAQSELEKQRSRLDELVEHARSQQNLIDALLPKGASAGLASAFAHRVSQVERTKWMWALGFVASVLGLVLTAVYGSAGTIASPGQAWWNLLERLPLAGPLVWLGWFSAMQYGNTVRLQEDYAFKEATSKAFAGYRDHMEHMAAVDSGEAGSAMKLLAERTIQILARDPLRIYGKSSDDAAPTQTMLSKLLPRFGKPSTTD